MVALSTIRYYFLVATVAVVILAFIQKMSPEIGFFEQSDVFQVLSDMLFLMGAFIIAVVRFLMNLFSLEPVFNLDPIIRISLKGVSLVSLSIVDIAIDLISMPFRLFGGILRSAGVQTNFILGINMSGKIENIFLSEIPTWQVLNEKPGGNFLRFYAWIGFNLENATFDAGVYYRHYIEIKNPIQELGTVGTINDSAHFFVQLSIVGGSGIGPHRISLEPLSLKIQGFLFGKFNPAAFSLAELIRNALQQLNNSLPGPRALFQEALES